MTNLFKVNFVKTDRFNDKDSNVFSFEHDEKRWQKVLSFGIKKM